MKTFHLKPKHLPDSRSNRRGAVAVLVALLLIPLMAFLAFCVDVGWMTMSKSELQNAADAAAAAGAKQLASGYATYVARSGGSQSTTALVNTSVANAKTYAANYAGFNQAGGVSSLALPVGDISIGFTNASGAFSTSLGSNFPNTVKVTTRLDATANGKLPLFFGSVIGLKSTPLTASTAAMIHTGVISSFDTKGGGESNDDKCGSHGNGGRTTGSYGGGGGGCGGGDDNGRHGTTTFSGDHQCKLMPLCVDVDHWSEFCSSGKSPDGTVHLDTDGTPHLQVLPCPTTKPGCCHLACCGSRDTSSSTLSTWVCNGPSATDVGCLHTNSQLPCKPTSPCQFPCTTSIYSSCGSDLSTCVAQPRVIPVFKSVNNGTSGSYQACTGSGSNQTSNVCAFVGCHVSKCTGSGSSLTVCIKPCATVDPTAVYPPSTVCPCGTEPTGQVKTGSCASVKICQ